MEQNYDELVPQEDESREEWLKRIRPLLPPQRFVGYDTLKCKAKIIMLSIIDEDKTRITDIINLADRQLILEWA